MLLHGTIHRPIWFCLVLALTAFAQPRPVELAPDQPLNATLAPGTATRYRFRARSGDHLHVLLRQAQGDLKLRLIDPGAKPMAEALDRGGDLRPLRIYRVAPLDGDYVLEVDWRAPSKNAAQYQITLSKPRPATEAGRDRSRASQQFEEAAKLRSQHQRSALEESVKKLIPARETWHALGDREDEAEALRDLAETSAELGLNEDMLQYSKAELALRRDLSDRLGQANALNNLGYAEATVGRKDDGLSHLEEAVTLWRELGDHRSEAISLSNIGKTHYTAGDYYQSLKVCRDLEPIRRKYSGPAGIASTLNCIGMSLLNLGEFERSVPYLERAGDLFRTAGDRRGEATVYGNLALWFIETGNYARAADYNQRALGIVRSAGNGDLEALSLARAAECATLLGDGVKGLEWAELSLAKARTSSEKQVEAYAVRERGRALAATRQYDAAVESVREAIATAKSASHLGSEIAALEVLSDIEEARGNREAARDTLRQATERLEVQRSSIRSPELRMSYFAQARRIYEKQIQVLMDLHQSMVGDSFDSDALAASERARARVLVEMLPGETTADIGLSVDRIRSLLDADTSLIEFALGARQSYGWMVTRDGLFSFRLPAEEEITSAANALHLALRGNNPSTTQVEVVSRMLLGPLAKRLTNRRVVVVSDGALQLVPFAALTAPGTSRPLLADHEVVTLPSATALAHLRRLPSTRPAGAKQVTVVADPVFQRDDLRFSQPPPPADSRGESPEGATDLGRLPGTMREADAILKLVPSSQASQATGFAATREFVLNPAVWQSRIVHLATHGVLNYRSPELSGLVFSQFTPSGKPHDGFVRLPELQRLHISSDLVVLSACQTALGKEVRGEGLMGLARALMAAGGKRVVGTLWQVPDSATVELMKRFYSAMLADHLRPAAALRRAQIELRGNPQWASPYFWAGFELLGEWQ